MPISIGSNIASLNVQRKLADANSYAEKIYQRLSSGARINTASDDAAGLAIAQNLNTDTKVFTQAVRNGNDGLSVLAIADSVVSSLSDITVRLRELAEQAANGTFSNAQRQALDTEAQALSKEYFRISRSAKFNGVNLFDGTVQDGLRFQLGYGLEGSLQSNLGGFMGNGTFGAAGTYVSEGTRSEAVEIADLNGDGILDIITAGDFGPWGYATIQLGVGDGTYGAATSYLMNSSGANDLAVGDLNGDGILDLVTAGGAGANAGVSVRLGVGDGTFGGVSSFDSTLMGPSASFSAVALGDFNGDGILDIAAGGASGIGSGYEIRLGTGNGEFSSSANFFTTGSEAVLDIYVNDINGDNIMDIAVGGGTRAGFLLTRLGNGDATFNAALTASISPVNRVRNIDMGDINNDGILDFVIGTNTGIQTALGQGNGTFGAVTSFVNETSGSSSVVLGDFDSNGTLDLVTTGLSAGSGFITVRLGSGTGTFGTATSTLTDTTNANGVATADLNGDGVLDIVTAGEKITGRVGTFFGGTREGIAPILSFSLATKADALQAMGMLERNQTNLIKQRGIIGAFQSRLGVAINNLTSSRDNYFAAESRIKDTDIAVEAAELARVKVLQNAAVAVLAQANQTPRIALDLLSAT